MNDKQLNYDEWKLVPVEPTAEMVLAAFDAITNAFGEGMIRARWRCMLDAAPAAPQERHGNPHIERRAPARREDMAAFAAELKADPAKSHAFFQAAGIINEQGDLTPAYGGPVQQAEPVAWRHDHGEENGGFEYYEDASCPQCEPLYLHPPPAEVQRLCDALEGK